MLPVLVTGTTAWADGTTLKDAYKDHFYVGVAINRAIAVGDALPANNVGRNMEQVKQDIALTKQQYNQISPENDLKWDAIHPREGADGYNFGPADAFVDFGLKNNMYLVGHTLVWHGQTPAWVFSGNVPPVADEAMPGGNAPGGMPPLPNPPGANAPAANVPGQAPVPPGGVAGPNAGGPNPGPGAANPGGPNPAGRRRFGRGGRFWRL